MSPLGHVLGIKQVVRGLDLQEEDPKSHWTGVRCDRKMLADLKVLVDASLAKLG